MDDKDTEQIVRDIVSVICGPFAALDSIQHLLAVGAPEDAEYRVLGYLRKILRDQNSPHCEGLHPYYGCWSPSHVAIALERAVIKNPNDGQSRINYREQKDRNWCGSKRKPG